MFTSCSRQAVSVATSSAKATGRTMAICVAKSGYTVQTLKAARRLNLEIIEVIKHHEKKS